MARIQLPFVGAQLSSKELLIMTGIIGLGLWWIKRGVTQTISQVSEKITPVFSKPGEAIFDFFHTEDPEEDIYNITISDRININKQILEAQDGGYTHRDDGLH